MDGLLGKQIKMCTWLTLISFNNSEYIFFFIEGFNMSCIVVNVKF